MRGITVYPDGSFSKGIQVDDGCIVLGLPEEKGTWNQQAKVSCHADGRSLSGCFEHFKNVFGGLTVDDAGTSHDDDRLVLVKMIVGPKEFTVEGNLLYRPPTIFAFGTQLGAGYHQISSVPGRINTEILLMISISSGHINVLYSPGPDQERILDHQVAFVLDSDGLRVVYVRAVSVSDITDALASVDDDDEEDKPDSLPD
ncbi:MAG: hypothetical protein WC797_01970 [Candidatus Paceibacterota bacterium]|jgi:hypothetical protein